MRKKDLQDYKNRISVIQYAGEYYPKVIPQGTTGPDKTYYRDLYKAGFEKYMVDYLKTIGRSVTQASQMATDVFYLEKNDPDMIDYMYWFQSRETFEEAVEHLDALFSARKTYNKSMNDHIDYMSWFNNFLCEQFVNAVAHSKED